MHIVWISKIAKNAFEMYVYSVGVHLISVLACRTSNSLKNISYRSLNRTKTEQASKQASRHFKIQINSRIKWILIRFTNETLIY